MTFIIRKKQVRVNVLSVSIRKQSGQSLSTVPPCGNIIDFGFRVSYTECGLHSEYRSPATPVSANTAIHILARPSRPNTMTSALITRANATFLFCNSSRCSCNLQRLRDCFHRRGHKYHVCSFNRCIRSASHRSSHICACQNRAHH